MTTTAEMHAALRKRYSATSPGNGPRYVLAPEVRNQAGFGGYRGPRLRTCDLMVIDTWQSGPCRLIGHEIKVSRSDWLRELKDPDKAAAFTPLVSEWWLAVADAKIVKDGELPEGWGLLVAQSNGLVARVRAARQPQPDVPFELVSALMRAQFNGLRGEIEAAKLPRPITNLGQVPYTGTYDHVSEDWRQARNGEIQKPDYAVRKR